MINKIERLYSRIKIINNEIASKEEKISKLKTEIYNQISSYIQEQKVFSNVLWKFNTLYYRFECNRDDIKDPTLNEILKKNHISFYIGHDLHLRVDDNEVMLFFNNKNEWPDDKNIIIDIIKNVMNVYNININKDELKQDILKITNKTDILQNLL
jgi:hypothetical protein